MALTMSKLTFDLHSVTNLIQFVSISYPKGINMKCSSCCGSINIKDKYYFDKQLKFHCEACCGADAHQLTAVNELMKCDTCDSTGRWTCLCHFMNHCNSCLVHVHENGLNNNIQSLFANSNPICEECNLITSDYTNKENGKKLCFACFNANHRATSCEKINSEKKADISKLLDWMNNLSDRSQMNDVAKKITMLQNFVSHQDEQFEKIKQQHEEARRSNCNLIEKLKEEMKKLEFFSLSDDLSYKAIIFSQILADERVNVNVFDNLLPEPVDADKMKLKSIEVQFKVKDVSFTSIISQENNIEISPYQMDEPLSKRPRTEIELVHDNEHMKLIPYHNHEKIHVKVTYFRCPFYLILNLPGLFTQRNSTISEVNKGSYSKAKTIEIGETFIVSDNPKYGNQFKRGRILRKNNTKYVVKLIDHGPVIPVSRDRIYDCPPALKNIPDTVFKASLMNVKPRSGFAFVKIKNYPNAREFIQDKLLPANSVIEVTRHFATQETVFVTINSRVNGVTLDWADELIKAKIAVKHEDNHGCFLPEHDYCYMHHALVQCNYGLDCFRSHLCPHCKAAQHPLVKCEKFIQFIHSIWFPTDN